MDRQAALRAALLELGLEDLIPLWEPQETPEVRGATNSMASVEEISAALQALLEAGLIRVFAGPWHDNDPPSVGRVEGLRLLGDERRYSANTEIAEELDRVYFVNVDNLVE